MDHLGALGGLSAVDDELDQLGPLDLGSPVARLVQCDLEQRLKLLRERIVGSAEPADPRHLLGIDKEPGHRLEGASVPAREHGDHAIGCGARMPAAGQDAELGLENVLPLSPRSVPIPLHCASSMPDDHLVLAGPHGRPLEAGEQLGARGRPEHDTVQVTRKHRP